MSYFIYGVLQLRGPVAMGTNISQWGTSSSNLAWKSNYGRRCFYLAQFYSVASKFSEAYLLYKRSEQRADSASKKLTFDKVLLSKATHYNFTRNYTIFDIVKRRTHSESNDQSSFSSTLFVCSSVWEVITIPFQNTIKSVFRVERQCGGSIAQIPCTDIYS